MATTQSDSGGLGGHWPWRSWQFWGGIIAGIGVGLLLGAALVELELLTLRSKAWVSASGSILVGIAGIFVARRGNHT
jgi:hypothetical protein